MFKVEIDSTIFHFSGRPESHGVREQCVKSDIQALETPATFLLQQGNKAIIISGGPSEASQFTQRMPHYTTQESLLAVFQCREFVVYALFHSSETVERKDVGEDGQFKNQVETECPLFKGLETRTSTGDISSRVQGIYIDNGFLRKEESEQVVTSLQQLGLILWRVDSHFFFIPASRFEV
ncbi:hypothetical protein OUZ56_005869 [Daphnia magna]|uniref:GMP synthase n=1 Tax=Daphnia magna TaxID=35525 RepID=A0ABQ9YTZ9_9CRUS|nr:hypothetical protein OUZ56_005869 [Daphnia magna]